MIHPPYRCMACRDQGFAETAAGLDACRACTHQAEAAWRLFEDHRRTSMWTEHTNRTGRGSSPSAVLMEARGGRVILTLGRGALEQVPWYRGGTPVAVTLGWGADAGRMRVMRGDTHKLLSRGGSGLDRLPPVVLQMDLLPGMQPGAEHPEEAVAHRIDRGFVEVTLPSWAAPPVPAVAPPTTFQHGAFRPVERTHVEVAS